MPALARTYPADPPEARPLAPPQPAAWPAPEPDRFGSLRRPAPGIGDSGVHPRAAVAVLCVYAALVLAFCVLFATPATGLTLFVITVLGTMYFGLLGGGLLLADSPPNPGRSFAAFLKGRVTIATGSITGREAFIQMIAMPLALLFGAIVFGVIWHVTSH
jgi:hypothetical protein